MKRDTKLETLQALVYEHGALARTPALALIDRAANLAAKLTDLHEEDIYLQGPVTFSRRECWERHLQRDPTCDVCLLIRNEDWGVHNERTDAT